jgi:RNA polymerase sigma factor (sigma-70 family)
MFNTDDYKYWYEQYFPMIKKLVKEKIGSAQEAEDIFQETLVIALEQQNKKGFELTAKISTYLYSIARNKCNELIRQMQRTRTKPLDENTDEILEESAVDEAEQNNLITALRNCIEKLSDTRKKIIAAFYYKEMNMNEIAEKYNLSNAKSVKSQKYKAIQDLETCIEKQNKLW